MMHRILVLGLLTLTLAAGQVDTLSFRNGGNGVWPDAKPPTSWNEWAWKEEEVTNARGKRNTVRTITGDDRRNIAWKTELPFWGNGQPVVIDGRIYLLHELESWDESKLGPRLVCLDVKDGAVLWSKEVGHTDLIPVAQRAELVADWLDDRRFLARKWRAVWRMHQVASDDQEGLAAVWAEMTALGFSGGYKGRLKDKIGTKLSDHDMSDTARFWGKDPQERAELRQRLATVNLFYPFWTEPSPEVPGRWMGWTFPSPVSDGKRIYIRTAQHLLGCYDLEGEPVWRVLFAQKPGYCSFAPSPILVKDRLIVYSPGGRNRDTVLCRAFDTATGRQLWATEGGGMDYAIGTPLHLNLGGTDVVFLPAGFVLRVSDGHVLAKDIGWVSAADHPVAVGDTLYLHNAQDGGGYGGNGRGVPQGISAVRLAMKGADAVEATTLWQTTKADGQDFRRGLVVANSLVFATISKKVVALDAATGAVIKTCGAVNGAWNLTVAGPYLISAEHKEGCFSVLSADRELKSLGGGQLGQEIKKPADQWHFGNADGEWGVASQTLPIVPVGECLLIRTWFHLYCIGR